MNDEEAHQHFLVTMLTGTIAGVYVGLEYGVERIRGTRDWVLVFFRLKNFFPSFINPNLKKSKSLLFLSYLNWIWP